MNLIQSILLFLPLNWIICVVSSAPRRQSIADIIKHGTKLFLSLTAWIVGLSVAVHLLMEWLLAT